ncbi:molecular chaperone HtpG [Enteropsectra breve]|nr:molecular chaperone HtpG [Enteropsectra breve]
MHMADVVSENRSNVANGKESFEFEAEVPQVMSIIINSVYSSKELFLRELVSNASDALSKLLTQKEDLEKAGYPTVGTYDYKITIIPDAVNKTLIIKDNGIGMTKNDLMTFLGSIATSGTKKFREFLDKSKESQNELIGQFGLGFYSAFLVAERVDLRTKHPKDEGYLWSSCGAAGYSIEPADISEHGTTIILKLKEGEEEYLKEERLTDLIKKHSMFIRHKIVLCVPEKQEESKNENEVKEIDGEDNNNEDNNKNDNNNEDNRATEELKMVEKTINKEIPIWTQKIENIPEEDLKRFYKTLSDDYDDYLAVQSWHFEGMMDLRIMLFIPKRAKMNLFDGSNKQNKNIKLFNSNVFVTDDIKSDIVPEWMNFVVGAVSSSDFPMNVSREFLQGKAPLNLLKTKLPKCIAKMIEQLDATKFEAFYKEFSTNMKMAVRHYTDAKQDQFTKFLRYATNKDFNKNISLDEYLKMVPENSKQILVLTGLNKKEVENSLYLEAFKDKTVLLMPEAIDEIMLQGLRSYQGLDFQRISSEGVENNAAESNASFAKLKEFIEQQLKDLVERVEISSRFSEVPAMLLTTKYANSSAMESIIKSHPGSENNPMLMMMLQAKKIFEVNVENAVIKKINEMIENGDLETAKKYVKFLYDSALVGCGFILEDKGTFVKDLYKIFGEFVMNDKGDVLGADVLGADALNSASSAVVDDSKVEVVDEAN